MFGFRLFFWQIGCGCVAGGGGKVLVGCFFLFFVFVFFCVWVVVVVFFFFLLGRKIRKAYFYQTERLYLFVKQGVMMQDLNFNTGNIVSQNMQLHAPF